MTEFKIITMPDSDPEHADVPVKYHKTPQYLFDYGMCLCTDCGKLHSIDYAFCNDCFKEIFIDIDPFEKPGDAKIMDLIKKHRSKK